MLLREMRRQNAVPATSPRRDSVHASVSAMLSCGCVLERGGLDHAGTIGMKMVAAMQRAPLHPAHV